MFYGGQISESGLSGTIWWLSHVFGKGSEAKVTLCVFAVNASLHFRRLRIEERRDKFWMMFSSKAWHANLQEKLQNSSQ